MIYSHLTGGRNAKDEKKKRHRAWRWQLPRHPPARSTTQRGRQGRRETSAARRLRGGESCTGTRPLADATELKEQESEEREWARTRERERVRERERDRQSLKMLGAPRRGQTPINRNNVHPTSKGCPASTPLACLHGVDGTRRKLNSIEDSARSISELVHSRIDILIVSDHVVAEDGVTGLDRGARPPSWRPGSGGGRPACGARGGGGRAGGVRDSRRSWRRSFPG